MSEYNYGPLEHELTGGTHAEHPCSEQVDDESTEGRTAVYADYERDPVTGEVFTVTKTIPAAPERSERWHISTVKNDVYVAGSKVNATEIYVDDGRTDWCAQVLRLERAKQIVDTMNQHSALIEQREQLVEVLRLIQGFNWQLDDSPHGLEIKRRAELVLTAIEQE